MLIKFHPPFIRFPFLNTPSLFTYLLFSLFFCTAGFGQTHPDTHIAEPASLKPKWFIALPLRFTQLQNTNTLLSGIKIGRGLNKRISLSLSIYHSFYLKSFKATANLVGFEEQARLFINCMGVEGDLKLLERGFFALQAQALIGWGFMKYDLAQYRFKSKQVNYLALEPALCAEFRVSTNTCIGLGLGYRPLLSNKKIYYTSTISEGNLPLHKEFANGLNMLVSLKGYL